jgi:hypothetical protein
MIVFYSVVASASLRRPGSPPMTRTVSQSMPAGGRPPVDAALLTGISRISAPAAVTAVTRAGCDAYAKLLV